METFRRESSVKAIPSPYSVTIRMNADYGSSAILVSTSLSLVQQQKKVPPSSRESVLAAIKRTVPNANFQDFDGDKSSIAPSLNTLDSTTPERLALVGCFALAATLACSVAAHAPLANVAAGVGHTALFAGGLITVASVVMKFAMTKAEVSESNRLTFEYLQKKASIYSKKMGLRETPEIRMWRKYPGMFLGPAASFFFHKRFIIFDEDFLTNQKKPTLEGVLGHEMAHIKQNHIVQKLALAFLLKTVINVEPSLAIANLPIIMLHARRCEFQADRIGAVVSRQQQAMAEFFKTRYAESAQDRYVKWRDGSYLPKKIAQVAISAIAAPWKIYRYINFTQHPNAERRIEHFETMANPPSKYKSGSIKSRFMQLMF